MKIVKTLDAINTYRIASCLVVVSIVCCTVSLFALYIALPQLRGNGGKPLYDYQSVLVTILAILVAILLGWHIISVIDAKSKLQKQDDAIKRFAEYADKRIRQIDEDNENRTNELYNLTLQVRNDTMFFSFYNQGNISYYNKYDTDILGTYKSFVSALFYAVKDKTEDSKDKIRIALNAMKNCVEYIEHNRSKDIGEIKSIEDYNIEIKTILMSTNEYFDTKNRVMLSDLVNRIDIVISKSNEEN